MLILSNPHNPVGRAWKSEELEELGNICVKNNILIISDEIHSDLVLPGFKHVPTASLSEEIADICLTCLAPSKTFNLAGLSTSSMVISNKDLRESFDKQIENLHIRGGNIFGTEASIAAYEEGREWLAELLSYISENVKFLTERIENSNLPITPIIPEATYMIWLDCRKMGMTGKELSEFFIHKASVGMNEGSMFGPGGEGFMRMNLACPRSVIEKAMDNIEAAISINK